MRAVKFLGLSLLVLGGAVTCGGGLPSTTPLGGQDEIPSDAGPDSAVEDAASADVALEENIEAPSPPATSPTARAEEAPPPAAPSASAEQPAASVAPVEPGPEASAPPACDDEQATVPTCSELKQQPMECLGGYLSKEMCPKFTRVFKPKAAAAMMSCMLKLDKTSAICDPDSLIPCILEGINASCPTNAHQKVCEEWLNRCPVPDDQKKYLNQENCQKGLASLTTHAREQITPCLKQSCDNDICVAKLFDIK